MRCASCGTENRPGSRFCDNCGSPLAATCPTCGEPNRADARFCSSCGGSLRNDAPASAATAALEPGAPSSERRLVSVLFTDLVGFTTLAEDRDPEAVRELLNRYFTTATDVIGLHGGTVEKFIGDAVMAVWGTPVAHEDDAERAVRAALELVDAVASLHPDLRARAGVLTGEAAVTIGATNQGMVAGDLVNTAARLQGVAEPGTVLVGEATRRAAERAIVFEEVGDHSLKGKTAPIPAWRAVRVVAAVGGQGRADALEPPFVGRDEELRQLKEHLHAVGRERRVRLVSITGPAGIGKSRLVWELQKYADGLTEDVWWHRGRSPSYGEGITFWALGEMVRRRSGLAEDDDEATTRDRVAATVAEFVPDAEEREVVEAALLALLGVEPAPEAGRDALFPAWRMFFERIAARGTAVLVFEDLQWADSGLLDFIDHLVEWSRGLPVMVVTLARPELFDRRPDWGAARRNFVSMALEPLPHQAVRELLEGLVPGLPDETLAAIVGRAEGMPLYAVETVRALLSDGRIERHGDVYEPVGNLTTLAVPESLRSLIASRLDALEADDRALLQTASVLGQVFAPSALAAVSGREGTDVNERLRGLARRELLELETDPASPERGQYKFVQSLIREVAYGSLGRRDRRARHLAVARHYEALGDEELAGALANHYLAAREASDEGPEADAVAAQARLALRAAAERAAALGAHDHAIIYLDQALSVTTDPRERAELLGAAASSAAMAATESATGYAESSVEAYREAGDVAAAARASALLGRVLLDASEIERGVEVLETALSDVPADAPEAEAELAATLSRAYMRQARSQLSIAAADRALPIAERLDLDTVVAEALANKAAALGQVGRRREARALVLAAVELAEAAGAVGTEMRIRHNAAMAISQDDPRRSIDELAATLELARRTGDRGHYSWIAGTLGAMSVAAGVEWDERIALLREALEATTLKRDRGRLRACLAELEAARGENVGRIVAEMEDIYGETSDTEDLLYLGVARANALLAGGELAAAYEVAMRTSELQTQATELALVQATRAAIWLGDLDRTRRAVERSAALPHTGTWWAALQSRDRGALAALEGRRTDAVAAFREARGLTQRMRLLFDEAAFAVDAVAVLPAEPEVVAWAAEARSTLEALSARPYLERLDAALAAARSAAPAAARAEVAEPAR